MMECQLTEIRYSLNGISESQMNLLFSHLDRLDSQVIIKRVTDRTMTLSPDDIILEGYFTDTVVNALSRGFPPPLSFKVEVEQPQYLKAYAAFEWPQHHLLHCGVSLLPFGTMQQMIGFTNAWQYLRLITTTEVGSILKSWLAVKPKGLVAANRNQLEFVLPMHRMDFLLTWIGAMQRQEIDMQWLSGATGEVTEEHLKTLGGMDQSRIPVLQTWVERVDSGDDLDFARLFSRAMISIQQ